MHGCYGAKSSMYASLKQTSRSLLIHHGISRCQIQRRLLPSFTTQATTSGRHAQHPLHAPHLARHHHLVESDHIAAGGNYPHDHPGNFSTPYLTSCSGRPTTIIVYNHPFVVFKNLLGRTGILSHCTNVRHIALLCWSLIYSCTAMSK